MREGGGSFEGNSRKPVESPDAAKARLKDARIRSLLSTPGGSADLCRDDAISWLKGSIGLRTDRGASAVSDEELLAKYMEGGVAEWDPQVKKSVRTYLKEKGYL